ncbi:MAG: hypothetical protein AABY22_12600 [Nanoarchaeota archaeon]
MKYKKYCSNGKRIFDKKGAQTIINLIYKLDHIKMEIYQCEEGCKGWHTTTVDAPNFKISRPKRFRHKKLLMLDK